jgi:transposase
MSNPNRLTARAQEMFARVENYLASGLSMPRRCSMVALTAGVKFYLYAQATDMRKSFDGLCVVVTSALGCDPTSGDVYVFVNRRRDRIKLLVWDRTAFWLFFKAASAGVRPADSACDQSVAGSAGARSFAHERHGQSHWLHPWPEVEAGALYQRRSFRDRQSRLWREECDSAGGAGAEELSLCRLARGRQARGVDLFAGGDRQAAPRGTFCLSQGHPLPHCRPSVFACRRTLATELEKPFSKITHSPLRFKMGFTEGIRQSGRDKKPLPFHRRPYP